eukprot:scaffold376_cov454-Pavlova_lutheri.AAC.7
MERVSESPFAPCKESVISNFHRLMLVRFVINVSEDPTSVKVNEGDIATKLSIGIPNDISKKQEQHMQLMVDLGKQHDVSLKRIAASALKIDAEQRESCKRIARTSKFADLKVSLRLAVATVHAMPHEGKILTGLLHTVAEWRKGSKTSPQSSTSAL